MAGWSVGVLLLATAALAAPERPVDLNTATVADLAQLPGVGEVIASRIVRHRERSGKFRAVEELLVIRGISRKKLEALRPHVRVKAEEERGEGEGTEKDRRGCNPLADQEFQRHQPQADEQRQAHH